MARVVNSSDEHKSECSTVYLEDGTSYTISHNESVYITEEIPVDDASLSLVFSITKANDKGLVSGWANVSVQKDGSIPLDWHDDIIMPDTLEKAAMDFMMEYRESGVMHKGEAKGVVVESIVFTKEKQETLGIPEGIVPEGWFITVKVLDPEVFQKVKSGEFSMFSIQGKAKRTKVQ